MLALEWNSMEEIVIPGTESIRLPKRPDHVFAIVVREGVDIISDGHAAGYAATGELLFIPPSCESVIANPRTASAALLLLRFDCTVDGKQALLLEDRRCWLGFRLPQVQLWLDDFRLPVEEPVNYMRLQSRLYAIATACLEHAAAQDKQHVPNLQQYIEQTKQYILGNYEAPIDIELLAQQSGASASRFYRQFRRMTGLSPHKYVTALRLSASLRMLNRSDQTITEAAHAVGYQDEYYFSRVFKKHMGLSPSEYMGKSRARVANLSPVFAGDLTVLGVTPVLSLERGWSRRQEESLDTVAASNPDIILTSPVSVEVCNRLAEIAPVEVLYWKRLSWKDRLLQISEVLGLSSIAAYWLANFDQKAEAARFHIREQLGGEPFLLIGVMPEYFRIYSKQTDQVQDLFYSGLRDHIRDPLHGFSYLEVCNLEEAADLGCNHAVFLIPAATSEAVCGGLEEQWRAARGGSHQARSLFVRHEARLLYNAAIHEQVVENTVVALARRSNKEKSM